MPRVVRAIDLREPPPQYEFANGWRVQLAYLDAPGWLLMEAYAAEPTNLERLTALMGAVAPGVPFEQIDRVAVDGDYGAMIALAKGYAPELLVALGNARSAVAVVAAAPPSTPPSNPTTASPTSSAASPAPTGSRSRKSGTSRGTRPSSLSTP